MKRMMSPEMSDCAPLIVRSVLYSGIVAPFGKQVYEVGALTTKLRHDLFDPDFGCTGKRRRRGVILTHLTECPGNQSPFE